MGLWWLAQAVLQAVNPCASVDARLLRARSWHCTGQPKGLNRGFHLVDKYRQALQYGLAFPCAIHNNKSSPVSMTKPSGAAAAPSDSPNPDLTTASPALAANLPLTGEQLWLACVDQLAKELPEQQFNTWIRPLAATVSPNNDRVTLMVGNRFKLDWIRAQYAQKISGVLQKLAGSDVHLELALAAREASPKAAAPTTVSPEFEPMAEALAVVEDNPNNGFKTRLNTALTFDNLIEGSANRMARAAALHVAGSPGQLYNPLFIYGGVGLGKTHLVHAVGNKLLTDNPNAKVLYIHAEQFVSDVVKAYQRKTFDEFKERYHSLDLLLIDDVQFFANKDRTQEEFFNAFEALLAKKSHIVLTSDTYPKGLADIHERLVSRFDSGLTVSIEPPELEMRVAIIINKARVEGAEMPEEVAFFVAKNVRSNVRELEGALRKILAYSRFNQKEISIGLAREALRDLLTIQNRQISVENIQKTVADYYKIKVADMYSKKRPASIARPRQIAMYLAKELTQKSLPEIGELFGGRDHTTVLHAVRKIAAERQQLTELNQQLHVLEQTLKG
jgi:chromosomal replication initiator protein